MNSLIYTFLLLLFATPSHASESALVDPVPIAADLVIIVKEKGTRRKLRRVEVNFGTHVEYTNKSGTVKIKNWKTYKKIKLERFGFEILTIETRNIVYSEIVQVYLFPRPPDDNEIRISGKKRPEVSRITVATQDAIKIAPSGDPVQIAKLLPGVQKGGGANQGRDNRVVIRGSGPEDSKYYIDDIQVPIIFHTIGNLSIVPEQMIEEIEFSTGGFGPKYGDATGGIIVVKTKNKIPERSKVESKANCPIYSGVYYEAPINSIDLDDGSNVSKSTNNGDTSTSQSSISVSYRRSYIQYLLPIFLKQAPDRIDIDVVPYFGDVHLQYLTVNDSGYSKLNLFNSHDGLELTGNIGVSEDENGSANIDVLNSFTALSY